jgi:hypothetical protein
MPTELTDLIGDPTGKDPKRPGYQAIILYDPQRTKSDPKTGKGGFDEKFVDALELFVKEHSGGLCYIAGNKYTDDDLIGPGAIQDLRSLLPVDLAPNLSAGVSELLSDRPPQPWPALVTGYGIDHQITRLGDTAGATAKAWAQLPGLYWSHPVARIKPAARVLLERQTPAGDSDSDARQPLLALHMYGKGLVAYLGTCDTWRWRIVEDARYHKRFWANLVEFLATLKASRVVITAGGDTFSAGSQVKVDVEAYDEKYRPLTEPTFTVEVVDTAAGGAQKLVLTRVQDKDGRYSGTLTASRCGVFEITAPGIEGVEAKRFAVKLPEAEALRSEANEEFLKSLAAKPEYFLPVCDAGKLAELIPSGKLTSVQENPLELWDTPWMLAALVALLVAEWILRKKYNMA